MPPSRCLLVFTKPAVPGRVKTRLVGPLTRAEAAELHEALLGDQLERLTGGGFDIRVLWALDDGEALPRSPHPAGRQVGADLGARLAAGLREAGRDYDFVAAVGSDHPGLAPGIVSEAFEALEGGAGVVLGPACDGGYYLVGLRAPADEPGIFEGIPWSTGEVLGETLARCRRLGLEPRLLGELSDVDTPQDLDALATRLMVDGAGCPRTAALLRRWKKLPEAAGV